MDLQNEKRDHPHLPHSPPSEVEGVRIVLISFRNIAKSQEVVGTERLLIEKFVQKIRSPYTDTRFRCWGASFPKIEFPAPVPLPIYRPKPVLDSEKSGAGSEQFTPKSVRSPAWISIFGASDSYRTERAREK